MLKKFNFHLSLNDFLGLFSNEIALTIFSLIIVFIAYTLVFLFIKQTKWSSNSKRRGITTIRNLLFFIFIVVNFFVWSTEIKTAIFSAAAIVGAMFIVFKEILVSFVGTIISNKTFKIGDFIEMNGIKGKIIDKNFLNTTVLINGPYQSSELIFPNMSYINDKIVNLSIYDKYRHQSIWFYVPNHNDILIKAKQVQEYLDTELSVHYKEMNDYFEGKEKNDHFFNTPDLKCKITYSLTDHKTCGFYINYILNDKYNEAIENKAIEFFLGLK